MRIRYRWVFWLALALIVVISAASFAVITDLSLFRATPLQYTATMVVIAIGIGLLMKNRFYLPLLRNMRLTGKLMLAPLLLLILSSPAAIIYLYYDLTGKESLRLLSALFASLAAVFFLATIAVVTLPSMASVLHMLGKVSGQKCKAGKLGERTLAAIVLLSLVLAVTNRLTGFNGSGMVFVFPLLALILVTLDIILTADFRNALSAKISVMPETETHGGGSNTGMAKISGFRSRFLFSDHYMDLISGRLDILDTHADDTYASVVVAIASKSFDPALLPALRVITAGSHFGEKVRSDAATAIQNIEKYYFDPVRNKDLLRLSGISEKTAAARGIMLIGRRPQISEIIRFLGDASPEIRKTGLLAAGRYGVTELREEVVQALSNPETAREAFLVLHHFGPDVYGDIIGKALRKGNSERENLMIMRLLEPMPLSGVLPYLINFVAAGHISVRLKAARNLCERGYVPQGKQRQMIEETLDEILHTIARLIALQLEAKRNRYFILTVALDKERATNTSFMFSLLTLLTGRSAAEVIMSPLEDDGGMHLTAVATEVTIPSPGDDGGTYLTGIAVEAIDEVIDDPVRRPLKALLGNNTDRNRLAELALYYPVREMRGKSVASFILSSEQNITGIWTKACAFHKVAAEGKGLEREQAVSYLFSNSQLLQEESARAIRSLNPEWYLATEPRLSGLSGSRLALVVRGELAGAAMIFEKTRFLSLCFSNIPEEKIILLAQGMRYSESYDAGPVPEQLSWVVPSREGKSGLYSLPVRDIENFVFHYIEYTDIFVHYIDRQKSLSGY